MPRLPDLRTQRDLDLESSDLGRSPRTSDGKLVAVLGVLVGIFVCATLAVMVS